MISFPITLANGIVVTSCQDALNCRENLWESILSDPSTETPEDRKAINEIKGIMSAVMLEDEPEEAEPNEPCYE